MFVVTIDQRGSRFQSDRVPDLLAALRPIPTIASFDRTAGDEVQGLLGDVAAVRDTLLVALRQGDWHCGVGVGEVEEGSFASSTRAGRGSAYLAAREAVEAAKSLSGSVAVRAACENARSWAADCEAVWQLVGELVQGRTAAQWRVVDAVDQAKTQVAAAEELGMQPGSVAGALKLSRIREERAAYGALDRLLSGAEAAAL